MWSVFVISFTIFDAAPPSKWADFLFYFAVVVVAPSAGHVAFCLASRREDSTWFSLSTETLVLILIAISTLTRSSILLALLCSAYFVILAVLGFAPRIHFSIQGSKLLMWERVRILATVISAVCFFRLVFTGITSYL